MKLWNGQKRMVHVRGKGTREFDADFLADDYVYIPRDLTGIFYLDGKEVYRYAELIQYWYTDISCEK